MKVLVTGATGFVGEAVARALRRHGHDVLGLVRDPGKGRHLEQAGVTLAVGDMWKPETYRELPGRVDAVIHAAQYKPSGGWSRRHVREMHESDALMTRTLAAICLEQRKRFVYTSGGLCYQSVGDGWVDETATPNPVRLARGHAEMVAELKTMHRERGFDGVVVTPGFVYGPGGMLKSMIEQMRRGELRVIDGGKNWWSNVHVDDLGEMYVLALERGRSGEEYFAADEEPMKRREVTDVVADAMGVPRPGNIPGWVVGLWLGFALVEAVKAPMRMRNDKAKRELGWSLQYPTFRDGLPAALAALGGKP